MTFVNRYAIKFPCVNNAFANAIYGDRSQTNQNKSRKFSKVQRPEIVRNVLDLDDFWPTFFLPHLGRCLDLAFHHSQQVCQCGFTPMRNICFIMNQQYDALHRKMHLSVTLLLL